MHYRFSRGKYKHKGLANKMEATYKSLEENKGNSKGIYNLALAGGSPGYTRIKG